MVKHPSCSDEQQIAQKYIINEVAKAVHLNENELNEKKLLLKNDTLVNVDGYNEQRAILCEAWAHIGKPKVAQMHKVMNDVLKMIFIEKSLNKNYRKILAFCDSEAASKCMGDSWHSACLKEFGIEIMVVNIPVEIKNSVIQAQLRQYR